MPVLSSISEEIDEFGFKTGERFVTERGFELTIRPTAMGLYEIIPHSGGIPPTVCNGLYTSHLKAREALIAYIETTDRNGYAVHPDKPNQVEVKSLRGKRNTKQTLSNVREGTDNRSVAPDVSGGQLARRTEHDSEPEG